LRAPRGVAAYRQRSRRLAQQASASRQHGAALGQQTKHENSKAKRAKMAKAYLTV